MATVAVPCNPATLNIYFALFSPTVFLPMLKSAWPGENILSPERNPTCRCKFHKKVTGNAFNWTLGGSLLLLSHSQLKSLIVHQTLTSQNIDLWMTMLLIVIITDIIQIQNKPSQFRSDPQLLRDQQQAPHLFCISITLESKMKLIYNANHTIIAAWMSQEPYVCETITCIKSNHFNIKLSKEK